MKWEEKSDMNVLIQTHGDVLERIDSLDYGVNYSTLWIDKDDPAFNESETKKYIDDMKELIEVFKKDTEDIFRRYFK